MLRRGHLAILSSFSNLPFVIKIFVLSIFGWPLKTGFTVFLHSCVVVCGLVYLYCDMVCYVLYDCGISLLHIPFGTRRSQRVVHITVS